MLLSTYINDGKLEAGCDEAGRGCLAGPVVAAAVILPPDFHHPVLNDSKQLSAKQRAALLPMIESEALAFAVSKVFPHTIDKINILNASFLAMHFSVKKLKIKPHRLLIDGNRFKAIEGYEHHCIIKGDGKIAAIAAASILAKEYRDRYMINLNKKYPHYCWDRNMGYPTEEHRRAIKEHGPCEYHRRSFRLYPYDKQGALF